MAKEQRPTLAKMNEGKTTITDVQNFLYCMIGFLGEAESMDVHFTSSAKDNKAFAEFIIENCRMRIETTTIN